jgi:hypothetical protein
MIYQRILVCPVFQLAYHAKALLSISVLLAFQGLIYMQDIVEILAKMAIFKMI